VNDPPILPAESRGTPVFVPREGRIDRRQLDALLRLLTAQMLRRGTDASSGVKGHPLVQVVVSMGLLGLLNAGSALRAPDLDGFLARLFLAALVLATLAITAETDEVRQRNAEVLLSKPVAAATHLASRAAVLLVIAALVSASFALPSLLAASWRLGLSPWLVPLELATLVAGAFALALLWVIALREGVLRLGADRMRMGTQLLLVVVIGAIAWSAVAGTGEATGGAPSPASVVLEALPSTWLARFWTDGWAPADLGRRGALVLLGTGCALAFWRLGLSSPDVVFETTSRPARSRLPLPARLVLAVGRLPVLGRLLVPGPVGAVAAVVLTLAGREEASRLRGFTTLLLAVGFAFWGFRSETPLIPLAGLASIVFTSALEGLAAARQSSSAGAAWMLVKAPVTPRHLLRGVQWAVGVRFVLPPLLLAGALLVRQHGWPLAALLVLGELLGARLLVASALLVRPAVPLGEAPRLGGVLGQVAAWGFGVAGAIGYVIAATLAELLGPLGLVVAAVGVAGVAGASLLVQLLAATRLQGLEAGE